MRALLIGLMLALLAACAHVWEPGQAGATPVRAMTYNIRLDLASDGANAWAARKAMVADVIRHEAPDILGMQEVLLHQRRDLEAALPEYAFAGVGRDDGANAGEFSPVGWKRDRFELLASETFWLSPTPKIPGKAWDAAYPRIATWVLLRDRTSGRELALINTHFDHVGAEARARSAAMIAQWTTERVAAGESVIAMGDFNTAAGSEPIMTLADQSRSGVRLARELSDTAPYGPTGTFNGFRITANEPSAIDHVFVSSDLQVMSYAVITQHWGGRLPSDHYPVVVDVEPLISDRTTAPVPASRR